MKIITCLHTNTPSAMGLGCSFPFSNCKIKTDLIPECCIEHKEMRKVNDFGHPEFILEWFVFCVFEKSTERCPIHIPYHMKVMMSVVCDLKVFNVECLIHVTCFIPCLSKVKRSKVGDLIQVYLF